MRANNGAPGIDKTALAEVEEYGVDRLLGELADELRARRYRPLVARRVMIPKPGAGLRGVTGETEGDVPCPLACGSRYYLLTVKKNQPALYKQLKALPWRHIDDGHSQTIHGHGRTEHRSIKVVTIAEGILFPHAAQAIRITRKTRPRRSGRYKTVTVYAVTSLAAHQARPEELADFIRSHWQIEALHHIRDVTYREDHSQIHTGNGPAVMAALRNPAIGILKFCGWTNIAQADRRHAQDPGRCLSTLGVT
ncbi:ISAs1 family transposase [Actinoallomurus iriomotensis]|uniref:Transposase n=1 Tax=Actinoallomurus iriomotensis TaxID=478107 RepID=A0A9W6SEX4_9ACTN|nr:ISAs1 family transposase [Actinoallomurus iriomotensis]GLY92324.1 hypothetical protein Airi02_102520 [Actinoallomurus iriomotensis]